MKTIHYSHIIYKALSEDWEPEKIESEIKKSFGNYMNFTNVCQYLTGKEAREVLNKLSDNFSFEELTKEKVSIAIGMAHDYCANAKANQTLSNGIKVKNFLDSNGLEFKEKLITLLDNKLN